MLVVEEYLSVDGEVLDVDVTDEGCWVALVRTGSGSGGQQLFFGEEKRVVPPRFFEFPIVRAAGSGRALLVEQKRSGDDEQNGYLVTRTGTVESVFSFDWGIADLLVSPDEIVVTYGDQGGVEGLAVFDLGGKLTLGYNSSPTSGDISIDDCYCAGWGEGRRVFFYAYTGGRFRLVALDLESMHQDLLPAPYNVHGACALSVAEPESGVEVVLFHGSSDDPAGVYRCRVDEVRAERIGIHQGQLRGLRGGRFFATGPNGYTIVSPAGQ
jgi:hypothetical protein